MRSRSLVIAACAAVFATLAFAAQASAGSDILVVNGGCSPSGQIKTELEANPAVGTVSEFGSGIPTAALLAANDLVVSMSSCGYPQIHVYGDRLADYVDGGGHVIQYAYDNWNNFFAAPQGRWASGGYAAFVGGPNTNQGVTLGVHDATHPLMAGVDELNSLGLNTAPTLASDATLVASWSDGRNAVPIKGRAVSVSAYLGDGAWTGDFAQLTVNAIDSLASGSPDPLDFGTQARDTVSATRTVTITIPGVAARPTFMGPMEPYLGPMEVVGPNADDFWLLSETCPLAAPSTTTTCTAKVRFIPSAAGALVAKLRFSSSTGSNVPLHGVGGDLPQGAPGTPGAPGAPDTPGTAGTNGTNGTSGTNGAPGTAGIDGTDGADGAKGKRSKRGRNATDAARIRVRCETKSHGSGARTVCRFNRQLRRNTLVQLRDRRSALSTARGNGKRTMVFMSRRMPRGTVYAFVIKGLHTS